MQGIFLCDDELALLRRLVYALETIAENTKSEETKEREYQVKGFKGKDS